MARRGRIHTDIGQGIWVFPKENFEDPEAVHAKSAYEKERKLFDLPLVARGHYGRYLYNFRGTNIFAKRLATKLIEHELCYW